jgi:hypothetical protein
MTRLIERIKTFHFPDYTIPLALLAVTGLAYGVLIPWLGFYWDDWAFIYIGKQLGSEGLARYFATNRPFWGMIYQFTTAIIGPQPWKWQVFGLIWRWLASVALWWLVRQLWPQRREAAAWAALLFIVFPALRQQPIAILYGHFYIVVSAFFLSLALMLKAVRDSRRFWLWAGLSLLLSLVNLLCMEYFFLLDLLRPVLLWVVVSQEGGPFKDSLKAAFKRWLPWLALFISVLVWRQFFFQYQNTNYEFSLLTAFQADPIKAMTALFGQIFRDIWTITFAAWGDVFTLPDPAVLGRRTTQLYAVVALAAALGLGVVLTRLRRENEDEPSKSLLTRDLPWVWQALLLGALGLLVAGWPFWLTGLKIGLRFPNDRFSISFMLGASLFVTGLLGLIPLPRWSKHLLLAALVGLGAGFQFRVANDFRHDWGVQQSFFWQMTWRMPSLQPGTTLVSNELDIHNTDNSTVAPVNWIYAPDNHSDQLSYMYYYPTIRLETGLQSFASGQPIEQSYLAATFNGSTEQIVPLVFDPPGCLRVLDSELEPDNIMVPALMRTAAEKADYTKIILSATQGKEAIPPTAIFGPEPELRWCYYFEKADLARQMGDWEQVAQLGAEAFRLGDYPNDPAERLVFIEGFAHVENWPQALDLTWTSNEITNLMQPLLCTLWGRIDEDMPASPGKQDALDAVQAELGCEWE